MFNDTEVGILLSTPYPSNHDFEAAFRLSPTGAPFVEFFRYMVDESEKDDEFPFPKEYLSPDVWWLDDDGVKKPIDVPAVYIDGPPATNTAEPVIYWSTID
jgi:hypothetical protein